MLTVRRIYWPAINLIGPGCVKEIGEEIVKLGMTKALFVTDKVLNQVGVVKQVTDVLDASGISYAIFDDVKPNPTTKNVNDGLAMYKQEGCDFIISLGGGSPQDAAKAVGILAANGGNIVDYEGIGKSKNKSAPIIAINTTAGTASEVTVNYVITDEVRKIKMVMVDPNSMATIAVNDPELMVKKPAGLTAATGMDALTHAIEAYVTKGAFPLSDALALQAIKFISHSLVDAVKNGNDIAARSEMAWGSYVAGLSFSNCGLGIVHSMAHQLGSEYDLPHGVANAILLPYIMDFNLDSNPKKFAEIAEAMGEDTSKAANELEAAKLALDAVRKLSKAVGIPALKETSFNPDDAAKLADQAMRDVCTGGNPKEVSKDDMIAIYMTAYKG
ncbi:iron-containing alcohol dehydrogenase [Gorillibacterium sp. sgz5001074]|uniref:iron-containing alcohol dehydrogenase n=1 Tax=Gorillibacterium sp. sgz5001074 TaxID=3446695 RepID=UPI003F6698B4